MVCRAKSNGSDSASNWEGTSVSDKAIIFIDANQYLDLYQIVSGKKLLAALQEQGDHILVTEQVVHEVYRNKVSVTANFLAGELKKLELNRIAVSDHFFSATDDRIVQMRKQLQANREQFEKTKGEFTDLAHDLLEQVSQSKDEVSKVLDDVFSHAVAFGDGELQRARDRRERGNPPGKPSDPLGDQLNWEQILSHCKHKTMLWIITRDPDYGTVHEGKMFLNAALCAELARLYKPQPEVYCFDNIAEGLSHFASTTGTKAEKLPTPEETKQIKKEQESLPPVDWMTGYDDSGHLTGRLYDAFKMRDSMQLAAALASQVNSEQAILPPESKKADKPGN
jgi:hypothetical protein